MPGVTVRLLSRLGSAVALRRAVVRMVVSGPGRIVVGGRLVRGSRRVGLRQTAISFSDAGALRVSIALSPRARTVLRKAKRARLDLGLVVGAPLPSDLAQNQRARLILRR